MRKSQGLSLGLLPAFSLSASRIFSISRKDLALNWIIEVALLDVYRTWNRGRAWNCELVMCVVFGVLNVKCILLQII